jgi:hypothetical protein
MPGISKRSRYSKYPDKGGDPDADWMLVAEKIASASNKNQKAGERFIPAIPQAFLISIASAGDAIILLLISLAEMRIRRTREISLGPQIWMMAGNPSKRVRCRLLRQISRVPASVCTLNARPGRPYLLKAGPDWPKAQPKY